jgi:aryl-alcohol dehydrogenase-like predicted oxidoreductase
MAQTGQLRGLNSGRPTCGQDRNGGLQQYSLLSRESEWEVVPAALHNNVGILPWSPLAGGFLAGKYERGAVPGKNTRAGSDNPLYQWVSEEYANSDRNWSTIDAVVRIAREIGATPAQVALRWLADQPAVIAPIVGARSVEQLKENSAPSIWNSTKTPSLRSAG